MMSWDEVMTNLGSNDSTNVIRTRTTLSTLGKILELMDSPEKSVPFIHVAGSNGKGATARMMQSILTCAGYRTGLFISPHLKYMNERFSIDGSVISDEEMNNAAFAVRSAVTQYNAIHIAQKENPIQFALLTMMAFYYFARQHCDIAVIEVGIGGRLDSTNVIPVPELAMIMNLSLEHTALLGNTIAQIANEKGGIIKDHGHVVLYHQSQEAESVIQNLCKMHHAQLMITDPSLLKQDIHKENQEEFSYRTHTGLTLNLPGQYQKQNMLAVLDGVDSLNQRGWTITEEAIRKGLAQVTWPGRYEMVSSDPIVIVDGAHNPGAVDALIQTIQGPSSPIANKKIIFMVGAMKDKDTDSMLKRLSPVAYSFIMTTAPGDRAAPAEVLCKTAKQYFNGPCYSASSIKEALDLALSLADSDTAIVCCGSLYQVSEIRDYFHYSNLI